MTRVRHRRRLRLFRFVAAVAPVLALALVGAAFVLEGRWLPVASAAGALLSLLLGAIVLRLDRRWQVELATMRAAQAGQYAAEHDRQSAEHRSFTAHMIGLLDAAADRINVQRRRLDLLEAEIAGLRRTRPEPPVVSSELVRFADGAEWTELWPELAEAPTVVDLLKWDARVEHGPVADSDDDRNQRTA
jgi:hypothetical protein